jgi:hypothetical protein
LRDVADVPFLERLDSVTPAGAEQSYADLPLQDALPLVCRRVPMQFPQRSRIELENRACPRSFIASHLAGNRHKRYSRAVGGGYVAFV